MKAFLLLIGLLFAQSVQAQPIKGTPMKAVWAIGKITDQACIEAIDFIHTLGFNTLITNSVTPQMVQHAHTKNVRIIAVLHATATEAFAKQYPHALQQMRSAENKIADALKEQSWTEQTAGSFLWYSILLRSNTVCFEHPESQTFLKARVEDALQIADGVALDGFGFKNQYACFCDRCQSIRADGMPLAQMSEQTLINIHQTLYEHAKSINPNTLVVNHVWPPFRPDEYMGHKLKLDYCTQTISWFYPPVWRLERVALEAAEMKRLENPDVNHFVPFIGIHHVPDLVRAPERVAKEIEIALKYGESNIVISRLTTLQKHPKLAQTVQTALTGTTTQ